MKDSLAIYRGHDKAVAFYRVGIYYFTRNNDSALVYFDQALHEYDKQDDEQGRLKCYSLLASVYSEYGLYDTAITMLYNVLGSNKTTSDLRGFSCLNLGNIYETLQEYEKAKTFYLKAIRGDYLPAKRAAFANLGLIFLNNKEFDSAAFYFHGALREYYKSDTSQYFTKYNIANILLNLGIIEFDKGNYKKANDLLLKSLHVARQTNSRQLSGIIYLQLGESYLNLHQYDTAISFILKAKKTGDALGIADLRENTYKLLTEYYKSKGDYQKAFDYLGAYHAIHDSLIIEGYKSSIADAEVKYSVQEKLSKIQALKKEKRFVLGLSVTVFIAVFLLGLIIILLLNRHRLKLKYAKERAEAKSKMESMKTKMAEEKLEKMIASLHEKSAFIEELEQEIEKLSINTEKENIEEKVRKLRKTRILTDEDWEDYYRIFNEIHPLFFSSIKNYRDLSVGDKRQLIFLKLGLTQKEIAFLMGISYEGVKRARQRLAKKIGLNDAGELKEFIEGL